MESKSQKCKKILYKNSIGDESPSVLYGLIVDDSGYFITFKTARKEYIINRNLVISIESTDRDFEGAI